MTTGKVQPYFDSFGDASLVKMLSIFYSFEVIKSLYSYGPLGKLVRSSNREPMNLHIFLAFPICIPGLTI